jgi:predicted double-glycine peptidase
MNKQETDFSCGAYAVKIVLKNLLNIDISEKWCRKICNTKHRIGTDNK